ncbi:MAG TPA: malate synthase A [Parvularcula sp.]|nr:malate synthase A [Parvularcula sp.]HBS32136.1 malate synthase A [Parvularcula sp.]
MGCERAGLEIMGAMDARAERVLSPEAAAFLCEIIEAFAAERLDLLAARRRWQARIDAGALPDFRAETKAIRDGDWTVGPLPADLLDRRVEITGPVSAKMIINAMNADVKVFMADFEDALCPSWANVIDGQINLQAAIRRTLTYADASTGKSYALTAKPATLIARVRGLHLDEKHVLRRGERIPGALFDFALYFFHNWRALRDLGAGPYFYLPKLEHAEEARWWNKVFVHAQEKVGLPAGTIKATMLIETLPAVFEMDEILFELKDHAAALNCGRWDYIFSYIKTLKNHRERMLPDRHSVTMARPFLDAYSRLLVRTCHRRAALAMGGMSAFLPAKTAEQDAINKEKVRADKQREADNGHDGSWIAHPALAGVVNDVYSAAFKPGRTNQLDIRRAEDAPVTAADLLAAPEGPYTEEGLRTNIRVALQYIEAWLAGQGAVAIYGLMEDAATAEISRASIWQWIRNGALLDGGVKMTVDLFRRALGEEQLVVRRELGDERWTKGRFAEAAALLEKLCLEDSFAEFLTLGAYERL